MNKILVLAGLLGISMVSVHAMEEKEHQPQMPASQGKLLTPEQYEKLMADIAFNATIIEEATKDIENLHKPLSFEQQKKREQMRERFGSAYEEYRKVQDDEAEEALLRQRRRARIRGINQQVHLQRHFDALSKKGEQ